MEFHGMKSKAFLVLFNKLKSREDLLHYLLVLFPHLYKDYCSDGIDGFNYNCEFSEEGYLFSASASENEEGSFVYTVKTGGVLNFSCHKSVTSQNSLSVTSIKSIS